MTVAVAVPVQPLESVAVTVYVVVDGGVTFTVALLPRLLLHVYVPVPVTVSIADSAGQTPESPLIEGAGGVQTPGTVVTPADSALIIVLSLSQVHLVLTVCAGPSWSYTGNVVVHAPPLT